MCLCYFDFLGVKVRRKNHATKYFVLIHVKWIDLFYYTLIQNLHLFIIFIYIIYDRATGGRLSSRFNLTEIKNVKSQRMDNLISLRLKNVKSQRMDNSFNRFFGFYISGKSCIFAMKERRYLFFHSVF